MKAYPEYIETGDAWFGLIPQKWKYLSYRHLITQVSNGSTAEQVDDETPFPVSRIETISTGEINFTKVGYLAEESADPKFLLNKGDILFSHINSLDYVGNCAYYGNSKPLYHGMNLLRLQPDTQVVNPKFHYYLVKCHQFKNRVQSESKHAINQVSLSISYLKNIRVCLPPLSEQHAIADFLDQKTAQIDTLIEKKQRQIELLQEQRDVMTQNAMRSSETKNLKLGDVADWIKRPINRQDEELYERIGLYNRGRGIFHKPIAKGVDLGDSDFFEIKDGDFVISGQFAWEGAVALARQEEDGCFASHRYYSLRGKPDYAETAYLFSFFTTQLGDNLLNHHSRGAAGRNRPLNINTLLREKIPVPPLSMQKPITNLIEKTVVLKKNTQKLVDFLQEYRTALISEAVTGKIDVRAVHESPTGTM